MSNAIPPSTGVPEQAGTTDGLQLNVTVPITEVAFGVFKVDPFKALVGIGLQEILEPLTTGPEQPATNSNGKPARLYPCVLPDGEGISIGLGQFGEVGFKADDGLLVVTVPAMLADELLAHVFEEDLVFDTDRVHPSGAKVVDIGLTMKPGQRVSIPLSMFGELVIEVAS